MASDKQVILITGGHSGIGFETVKALCRSPQAYEIIIGSRTLSKAEAAISSLREEVPQTASTVTVLQTDLSSDSSLKRVAESIGAKYGRLDILVNNAGNGFDMALARGEISMREAFSASWDTNVVGPHILTFHLAPLLIKSSNPRLVFVSSGTSSLADSERHDTPSWEIINNPPPAGWPKKEAAFPVTSYRASKTGLNMVMREWDRMLKNDGVKVWGLEPGFLATTFAGSNPADLKAMGAGDPKTGGELIRNVVEGGMDAYVGKVVREDGVQPW
ncbi:Short-chain dehydrogenase/reductase 2b [Colletotrichum chlorophyti]|uniref:Short-chain dehydrogenase/reductase 2b n=1 Tax=Colletotrichum chlorophyti TaxID=708187 RepID=A0A1Q8S7L3_9PEZI|nr:Short-chain dehydrogenase/reductase 2b [Colletotrichum chlorophyti]